MAESKSFHCTVVTPEAPVLECDATFVAFPSHDGEVGVLHHRAPLLHRMGAGKLRVEGADGKRRVYFVDGGFAEMAGDRLTLLTEFAQPVEAIDRSAAEAALREALASRPTDEASFEARDRALARARAQLRILDLKGRTPH